MSFYICHCGNTEDNHNFRHLYEEDIKVNIELTSEGTRYLLNANDFEIIKKTKCDTPQCNGTKFMHNANSLGHEYKPVEYPCKVIKFTIPKNSECYVCKKTILQHSDGFMTHHFKTSIKIENNSPENEIVISDPNDDDIKIDWKN